MHTLISVLPYSTTSILIINYYYTGDYSKSHMVTGQELCCMSHFTIFIWRDHLTIFIESLGKIVKYRVITHFAIYYQKIYYINANPKLINAKIHLFYTYCCSLSEHILSLTPTLNSLMQKYIHFIQLTFTSIDTQPFASKGIP